VAVSKKRDKNVYKVPRNLGKDKSENPSWLLPTAVTALIAGVAWIVVYYISAGKYPVEIHQWNIGVGFAFLATGMVLLTRWK
jgi:Cell division protein CrgA